MAVLALPITSKVEVALNADLTAGEQTWAWTALEYNGDTRLMHQSPVAISRGQADERGGLEPGSWQGLLQNSDGELTPRRASSSLYPYFRRSAPLRYSVKAGLPHLLLTGGTNSRAGTPDALSLDITTDWAIAVEVQAPVYLPPAGFSYELIGKFNVSGNQRSIVLFLGSDGLLRLRWSTDGTGPNERNATATVVVPRPIVGTACYAVWLDVNDGAGGHKVRFYAAPTLAALLASPSTWQLGADTNSGVAGTTTVFASTAPLDIGDVTGSGFSPFPGRVRKAQVRAGDLTGTIQAQPDFTAQTEGATSFSDGIRTWTITSPAVIQRWQTRFLGQITDIKPTWPTGDIDGLVWAKVEAAGVLQRLQRNEAPIESALYRAITAPGAAAAVDVYFPLEDGRDATQVFSPIGGSPGGNMTMSLASDDSLPSSRPLPSVSGGQSYGWNLKFPRIAPTSGWEYTHVIRIPTAPAAGEFIEQRIDTRGGTTVEWIYRIDDAGFRLFAKDGTGTNVLSAALAADPTMGGEWTTDTVKLTQNGANIDWEVQRTEIGTGNSGLATGTLVGYTLGSPTGFRSLTPQAAGDGFSIGHFIITHGTNVGWLAPADSAYVGETAADRIARLCREHNIPATITGDTDASEPMGPQRALKLTELLAECAATDLGVLSELPNTVGFGYRCRNDLVNQTPAFTVDAELNLDIQFEAVEDDQRIVNDFTASRPEGSSYQVVDQDHIDAEDHYASSGEANVADDLQLASYAGWRLHLGTWPEMRYPEVLANLVADSAMHEAWLNAEVGDAFTVSNLPSEHPSPSIDLLLEGYAETISADSWEISLDNGPAGAWNVGVLDDDTPTTSLARLDTDGDTTTLAGSLNTTATGGQSVTVAGLLWTTDAAQFPLDVDINGEVVTLSGISGASSPQTFTISARSVNGVVKAHSAGAVIHPADSLRPAM